MGFQFSPDGRWWWDGRQWQPVEALSGPAPAFAMAEELREPPGTIRAAMWIGIVGSLLVAAFGLLFFLFAALIGSNPDLQQRLQQALDNSGASFDVAQLGTVLAVAGFVVVAYGVIWAGVNWGLMYFMNQRRTWAWIVTLVLIGLGTILDLVQAVHSPFALIHIVLIQLPMAALLLLSPTRRWLGIG